MSDLFNNFPSWGEVGEYPQDGFFYDGGDQVNEKHMDALWNGIQSHFDNLNTAIRDRVRDLDGNVVLDQGLVASEGSGTREVDVTASSDGAYVDGQRTGSVSADTLTHTTNGTGSTRTDVVWVNTDGSVGKTEDTTTTSSTQLKIAEVDVATDDTISAVRNYARDHAHHVASENAPSNPEPGDIWHDLTNDRLNIRQGGSFRKSVTEQDSVTIQNSDGITGGGSTITIGGSTITIGLDESVIKDGGSKEIDASEFDASSGSSGQVLTSDGSAAQWETPSTTDTPWTKLDSDSISSSQQTITLSVGSGGYDEYRVVGWGFSNDSLTNNAKFRIDGDSNSVYDYFTLDTGGPNAVNDDDAWLVELDSNRNVPIDMTIRTLGSEVLMTGPSGSVNVTLSGEYQGSGTISSDISMTPGRDASAELRLFGRNL